MNLRLPFTYSSDVIDVDWRIGAFFARVWANDCVYACFLSVSQEKEEKKMPQNVATHITESQ